MAELIPSTPMLSEFDIVDVIFKSGDVADAAFFAAFVAAFFAAFVAAVSWFFQTNTPSFFITLSSSDVAFVSDIFIVELFAVAVVAAAAAAVISYGPDVFPAATALIAAVAGLEAFEAESASHWMILEEFCIAALMRD